MPIFDAKPRSWDAYLAGIGASGALMASASVLFVILVGVVTFSAWPQAGSLFGDGGGGDVALQETAKPPPSKGTSAASGPNLVRLLGRGAGTTASGAPRFNGGRVGGQPGALVPGPGNGAPPGGSSEGGQQPQGAPQAPSRTTQANVVGQTVSGVGNTVQKDTESLGNSLGGSSGPGLGGVIGGLGRTLNNDLQTLAGKH